MAAPNTDTSALSNLVQAAYDQSVRLALRSMPTFRSLCDTRVVNQTQPGSSVVFAIHPDMSAATSTLTEVSDPTGVSLVDPTQVTVTLNEYGNFTKVTNKLKLFNLDDNLDGNIANIVAFNQNDSVDTVVETAFAGGSQLITEENATLISSGNDLQDIKATDTFKSKHARYEVAKLRGASVAPVDGQYYGGYIHPDVAHDLRAEAGSLGWRVPHEYGMSQDAIFAGEIGAYEGVRWIETPRCTVTADVGDGAGSTGTIDAYNTYVMGQGAMAEAVAEEFHVVIDGTIVDALKRFQTVGWYGVAGWSLFRTPSLWVTKTASSIGANA